MAGNKHGYPLWAENAVNGLRGDSQEAFSHHRAPWILNEAGVQERPSNDQWTVADDDAGIRALVEQVCRVAPTQVVIEATGGYELALVTALAAVALDARTHQKVTTD